MSSPAAPLMYAAIAAVPLWILGHTERGTNLVKVFVFVLVLVLELLLVLVLVLVLMLVCVHHVHNLVSMDEYGVYAVRVCVMPVMRRVPLAIVNSH
mmetsp:Transcript_8150/g.21526  ORF Transcript_8150/g.21526 Transcript_8150/m.21526 type:complete len:96 (+) Transcript_8150:2172-2459(+)